jgi:hypothetical protein
MEKKGPTGVSGALPESVSGQPRPQEIISPEAMNISLRADLNRVKDAAEILRDKLNEAENTISDNGRTINHLGHELFETKKELLRSRSKPNCNGVTTHPQERFAWCWHFAAVRAHPLCQLPTMT